MTHNCNNKKEIAEINLWLHFISCFTKLFLLVIVFSARKCDKNNRIPAFFMALNLKNSNFPGSVKTMI